MSRLINISTLFEISTLNFEQRKINLFTRDMSKLLHKHTTLNLHTGLHEVGLHDPRYITALSRPLLYCS